ncbi:hypothetical protein B296_00017471 [Ensete ventricosum]|uniref:Uncharacterized protein n=1 Tax=Ensete ventricosum TaxID=4639 RepID=A0A426ZAZ2_ENSVE|nr:hypothetical protein B296_00017471 [Ensete ventricosum]
MCSARSSKLNQLGLGQLLGYGMAQTRKSLATPSTARPLEDHRHLEARSSMISVHLSVVGFDVVAKESAWFGSARVRKFIHVDREEVGKLGRGRLGLLGNAPRAIPSRGLLRYPARRPRQGGGTRCGPSDDQVSAPTKMVLRINMKKEDEREFFPTVLFPGGVFMLARYPISRTHTLTVADVLGKADI